MGTGNTGGEDMGIKRKAMFFSIIAIIISSAIVFSFSVSYKYRLKEKSATIQTRVESMNNFIIDMEDDMDNAIFIIGFRSILSLEQYITSTGLFLKNTQSDFKEVFLNGTVNGTKINVMEDSTFLNWTGKIQKQAGKLDIIINFEVSDVLISQVDPWHVSISLNLTLNVSDKKKIASWTKSNFLSRKINIEGFEDPFYTINSFGRVFNIITKSNITDFVDQSTNDTTNLQLHLDNSYYIESDTAPNFLMRLEGNLSDSSSGIESLVDLADFVQQDVQIFERSVVDYIYFGNRSTNDKEIYFMPSWFRLDTDDNHVNVYETSGIVK